jgi:hypothetical protein
MNPAAEAMDTLRTESARRRSEPASYSFDLFKSQLTSALHQPNLKAVASQLRRVDRMTGNGYRRLVGL